MDRLTAEQAARLLGYNVKHLYRLVKEKRVKAETFGRSLAFDPDEIARLVARQGDGGRIRWQDEEQ